MGHKRNNAVNVVLVRVNVLVLVRFEVSVPMACNMQTVTTPFTVTEYSMIEL